VPASDLRQAPRLLKALPPAISGKQTLSKGVALPIQIQNGCYNEDEEEEQWNSHEQPEEDGTNFRSR
jgi:hypothetical protein